MDFTLPALSVMNDVTCQFYLDDSAKGRYNMILGRALISELVLNFKFSYHIIKADYGPLKGLPYPWLVWVRMNLKSEIQVKLHPYNHLPMLTSKKCIGWNMSVLPLKYYV